MQILLSLPSTELFLGLLFVFLVLVPFTFGFILFLYFSETALPWNLVKSRGLRMEETSVSFKSLVLREGPYLALSLLQS